MRVTMDVYPKGLTPHIGRREDGLPGAVRQRQAGFGQPHHPGFEPAISGDVEVEPVIRVETVQRDRPLLPSGLVKCTRR